MTSLLEVTIDCGGAQLFFPRWSITTIPEHSFSNLGETPTARCSLKIKRPIGARLLCSCNASITNHGTTDIKVSTITQTLLLIPADSTPGDESIRTTVIGEYCISRENCISAGATVDLGSFSQTATLAKLNYGDNYYLEIRVSCGELGIVRNARDYLLYRIAEVTDARRYHLKTTARGQEGVLADIGIKKIIGSAVNSSCGCLKPVHETVDKLGIYSFDSESTDLSVCSSCFATEDPLELQLEVLSPKSLVLTSESSLVQLIEHVFREEIKSPSCRLEVFCIHPKVTVMSNINCSKSLYLFQSSEVKGQSIEYHLTANFSLPGTCSLKLSFNLQAAPQTYKYNIYRSSVRTADNSLASGTIKGISEELDRSQDSAVEIPYAQLEEVKTLELVITKESGADLVVRSIPIPLDEVASAYASCSFSAVSPEGNVIALDSQKFKLEVLEGHYEDNEVKEVLELLVGAIRQKQQTGGGLLTRQSRGLKARLLTNNEFRLLLECGLHYRITLPATEYHGDVLLLNETKVRIVPPELNLYDSSWSHVEIGQMAAQSQCDVVKFPASKPSPVGGTKIARGIKK